MLPGTSGHRVLLESLQKLLYSSFPLLCYLLGFFRELGKGSYEVGSLHG